jgi:hypothetical protein
VGANLLSLGPGCGVSGKSMAISDFGAIYKKPAGIPAAGFDIWYMQLYKSIPVKLYDHMQTLTASSAAEAASEV